jgi:hypothetical protein
VGFNLHSIVTIKVTRTNGDYLDSTVIVVAIAVAAIAAFSHRITTQVADSFTVIASIVMRSYRNSLQIKAIVKVITRR